MKNNNQLLPSVVDAEALFNEYKDASVYIGIGVHEDAVTLPAFRCAIEQVAQSFTSQTAPEAVDADAFWNVNKEAMIPSGKIGAIGAITKEKFMQFAQSFASQSTLKEEKFHYCQSEIEDRFRCVKQCDSCKAYYKPLEDEKHQPVQGSAGVWVINEIDKARFWSKVYDTGYCWEWDARRDGDGYGVFKVNQKDQKASRIAYTIVNGDIPDNLHVLHKCDNPSCVNPDHLFTGTHQDNMNDKMRKGRGKVLGSASKYHGVAFRKDSNNWRAQVFDGRKHIALGSHQTEELAAKARDKYVIDNKLDLPINFPNEPPLESHSSLPVSGYTLQQISETWDRVDGNLIKGDCLNKGQFISSLPVPAKASDNIEKIAQWVIGNRYPKSENDKVSDSEMYQLLTDRISILNNSVRAEPVSAFTDEQLEGMSFDILFPHWTEGDVIGFKEQAQMKAFVKGYRFHKATPTLPSDEQIEEMAEKEYPLPKNQMQIDEYRTSKHLQNGYLTGAKDIRSLIGSGIPCKGKIITSSLK